MSKTSSESEIVPCDHCGAMHSTEQSFQTTVNGKVRTMCCMGCVAVSELIDHCKVDSSLDSSSLTMSE